MFETQVYRRLESQNDRRIMARNMINQYLIPPKPVHCGDIQGVLSGKQVSCRGIHVATVNEMDGFEPPMWAR